MNPDLRQDILSSDVIYALMRNLPNPELISDVTLNDSNKTLTVDANEIWEILSIWVELTSTATVGNRLMRLLFKDSASDIIWQAYPGVNQAASLSRNYLFAQNLARDTAFYSSIMLNHPLPPLLFPAGFQISIYDSAGVDPAADDLIVQMMINRYDVP